MKSGFVRFLALALIVAVVGSLTVMPASAASGQNVQITVNGQVVDSLYGVTARYIPGKGNSDGGEYSCAGYVTKFYKAIWGVTVSNLVNNATPAVSESGFSFKKITTGIAVGDICRSPGHWAIVKAIDGDTITLIEQNWKFLGSNGRTYATINRTVNKSAVTVFRLYKDGVSANGAGATSGASASAVEDLLFDAAFYASLYPDLRNAFGNHEAALKEHWKHSGIREGRIASPFFDPKWYMANHPDVARFYGATNWAGAYTHFIHSGFNEGRQGSPYFSAAYYLKRYPDLKNVFGENYLGAARHFLAHGLHEGRQASAQFSIAVYSKMNRDVERAYANPLDRISHYITYVQYGSEKRVCV